MDIALFIYNIILIILFTIAGTLSLTAYFKNKSTIFIAISIMFAANVLDNVIIFMTEKIDWFFEFYNNTFMTTPSLKTVIIIAYSACLIYITATAVKKKISIMHICVLIIIALVILFIPMLHNNAMQVWLYYLPMQILLFGLSIYGLCSPKKASCVTPNQKVFRKLFIITLIFALLILAEDSYVIFNLDSYADFDFNIYNRNISENILHTIYSIFAISHCFSLLISKGTIEEGEKDTTGNSVIDFKDKFCIKYDLTLREKEILALIVENKHNQDICDVLHISLGTVKTHIHNIYSKVGVRKREQLIREYEMFEIN